tara:strand:+ start:522 stop:659 length:138 start_codon:yes stop_codon:yes gene_type:complete
MVSFIVFKSIFCCDVDVQIGRKHEARQKESLSGAIIKGHSETKQN